MILISNSRLLRRLGKSYENTGVLVIKEVEECEEASWPQHEEW